MRRSLSALALATTIALATASAASAAPGELDSSFGDGGKLTIEFGGKTGGITDVAIQPDGKIVLAGWQFTTPPPYSSDTLDADIVVKRLNADGTPDGDFGAGGTQVVPVPLNTQPAYNIANAVALQPDGKILVGGYSKRIGQTNPYLTVVRLGADGQLDPTFQRAGAADGGPGMVVSGVGVLTDLAVDSQGRIVIGGTLPPFIAPDSQAIIRRWLASGADDPAFAGQTISWAAGRNDGGAGIALQPDGRILLAGYSDTTTEFDAGVARATEAGPLDTDFSGDGLFSFGLGAGSTDGASAVVVQPDGKIDVAGFGTTSDDFTLTRLTSAGAPDNSLAGSSTVAADFGGEDSANAMALLSNGKILLAGTGPTDVGFVRFQPGGAPDETFGPGGKRRVDFGPGTYAGLSAVTLQADGKVVAVGSLNDNSGTFKGTVIRLQGDSKDDGGAPVGPGGGKGKVYRCGGKRATIVGTNKRNRLKGTKRADVIVGLGGNDTISGARGNDIVCGGKGNDKISGGSGKDKLFGDSGKDRLSGDSGNDRESGGSGNDKLLGGSGKDILGGGSGKDGLSGGPGNDRLNGNSGKDKLNGGSGKDGCAGKDRKASC